MHLSSSTSYFLLDLNGWFFSCCTLCDKSHTDWMIDFHQCVLASIKRQFWIGNRVGQVCRNNVCQGQLFWQVGSRNCPLSPETNEMLRIFFQDGKQCARLRTGSKKCAFHNAPTLITSVVMFFALDKMIRSTRCSRNFRSICERIPNELIESGSSCSISQMNVSNAIHNTFGATEMDFQTGCALR